MTRPEC